MASSESAASEVFSSIGTRGTYVVSQAISLHLPGSPLQPIGSIEYLQLPDDVTFQIQEDPSMKPNQASYRQQDGSFARSIRWKQGRVPGDQVSNAAIVVWQKKASILDSRARFLRIGDRYLRLKHTTLTNPLLLTEPLYTVQTIGTFRQETHRLTTATAADRANYGQVRDRLPGAQDRHHSLQYITPDLARQYDPKGKGKARAPDPPPPSMYTARLAALARLDVPPASIQNRYTSGSQDVLRDDFMSRKQVQNLFPGDNKWHQASETAIEIFQTPCPFQTLSLPLRNDSEGKGPSIFGVFGPGIASQFKTQKFSAGSSLADPTPNVFREARRFIPQNSGDSRLLLWNVDGRLALCLAPFQTTMDSVAWRNTALPRNLLLDE